MFNIADIRILLGIIQIPTRVRCIAIVKPTIGDQTDLRHDLKPTMRKEMQ